MRTCFLILSLFCCSYSGIAQIIVPNGGFETIQTKDGAAVGWNKEGNYDQCGPDTAFHNHGRRSMHLSRSSASGIGNFYQQWPFTCSALKKYRLRCAMRTQNLKGKAGIGARVFDYRGGTICGYNAIVVSADQDWTIMTGEFYADPTASSIRLFCNLAGSGNVWFDDIKVEEIPPVTASPGKRTKAYVAEYFGFIKKYGIVKYSAFLPGLQRATLQLCAGDTSRSYCHSILKRYTTLKLNDGHSFFFTPADWEDYRNGSANTVQQGLVNYVAGRMLANRIAYLKVSTFASLDSSIIHRYVDSAQSIIATLDAQQPKGWVIDLSGNGGGNAFAMLPGLGPLLGDGVCGYSLSADGGKRTMIYREGRAAWDSSVLFRQQSRPYQLIHPVPPIALLYDGGTGSSGEIVAIAFRGKPNTRSFGTPTSGTTTRVDNLELSDGASLNLACGWPTDRAGVVYRGAIVPDTPTKDWDTALAEADAWIMSLHK